MSQSEPAWLASFLVAIGFMRYAFRTGKNPFECQQDPI